MLVDPGCPQDFFKKDIDKLPTKCYNIITKRKRGKTMTINFENYGKFFVTFYYDDETHDSYDGNGEGYTLKEAADFISENIENGFSVISADIVDFETGEIIASLEKEEPEEEDWYDYRDEYDECGFNPYMGCYDFDC